MRAEQFPPEPVDHQHADPVGRRELERIRLARNRERGEHGRRERIQARFGIPWQRWLDGLRSHDWLVVEDKARANASTCSTASAPSAASLIRMVTSSEVIAPV